MTKNFTPTEQEIKLCDVEKFEPIGFFKRRVVFECRCCGEQVLSRMTIEDVRSIDKMKKAKQ